MKFNVSGLYVASDLFKVGINEDGEVVYGEVFFVGYEDSTGARWRNRKVFPNARMEWDEDGFGGAVWDNSAEDRALAFLKELASANELDESEWDETYPAYGSEAYSEEDTIEWERRVEEESYF